VRGVDKPVRLHALAALGAIGSGATTSLPDLQTALRDDEADVRAAALSAYSRIEPQPATQSPALQAALGDEHIGVRRAAAEAIARLGNKASDATAGLAPLLKREEDREFALAALREISVGSLPHLLEMLESSDPSVRLFACERLGQLGSDARETRPALEQLAENPRQPEEIRRSARRAVRSIMASAK
ncbi:MAG: HEAT repeat domain-containing protein, partial [Verrucomicrobiota bacterium]|nr:HEAT repeat domain-containing protein [Verrucomicrobiota bacterium]